MKYIRNGIRDIVIMGCLLIACGLIQKNTQSVWIPIVAITCAISIKCVWNIYNDRKKKISINHEEPKPEINKG